jgi:hypothetical protein
MSLTLRTSLLIREFARLSGRSISAHVGRPIDWTEMEPMRDRRALTAFLQQRVEALAPDRSPVRRLVRLRREGEDRAAA